MFKSSLYQAMFLFTCFVLITSYYLPLTRSSRYMKRFKVVSMVSVSGSPTPPGGNPIPRQFKAFIISPSTSSLESEMLILQNFNQIQRGDRSKVAIIGTQDLSHDHVEYVELLTYSLVLSGNHIYTSGDFSCHFFRK